MTALPSATRRPTRLAGAAGQRQTTDATFQRQARAVRSTQAVGSRARLRHAAVAGRPARASPPTFWPSIHRPNPERARSRAGPTRRTAAARCRAERCSRPSGQDSGTGCGINPAPSGARCRADDTWRSSAYLAAGKTPANARSGSCPAEWLGSLIRSKSTRSIASGPGGFYFEAKSVGALDSSR